MEKKHVGGRGRKAIGKHKTFGVSLPPDLKTLLDSWVTDDLSRSGVVAELIQEHAALLVAAEARSASPLQASREPKNPRAKTPEGKNTREDGSKFPPITTVRFSGENKVRTTTLFPIAPTANPRQSLEALSLPSGEPVKHTPRASMRAGGVKRTATDRLAQSVPVLNIMQRTVPRGLGWKPERYDQTEGLLAQGDSLQADGVNYRTAKGDVMGYKTAEALVRLGVLVPA